jgi:inhibitor of KinA
MSHGPAVRFLPASDRSLLVEFGNEITDETHASVARLLRLLEQEPIPWVQNLHPAYCSLLLTFDARHCTHQELTVAVTDCLKRLEKAVLPAARLVEIPVHYGHTMAPDLDEVGAGGGRAAEEVVKLHSGTEYKVYFLGFVPGFAYMGEVPEILATPRLATPRRAVPAGSVGIAGRQTGIYPLPTPGGWRLIGRTPLAMFQPGSGSLLRTGDRVRFFAISAEEFARLEKEGAAS